MMEIAKGGWEMRRHVLTGSSCSAIDAIMAEITDMFANMTPEQLKAKSQPVDWENIDDDERAILEQALGDFNVDERKNRLQ